MGEVPFTSQMGRAQSRSREIDEEDEEDLFVCLGNEGDLRACVVSGLRLQITLIFFEREISESNVFISFCKTICVLNIPFSFFLGGYGELSSMCLRDAMSLLQLHFAM